MGPVTQQDFLTGWSPPSPQDCVLVTGTHQGPTLSQKSRLQALLSWLHRDCGVAWLLDGDCVGVDEVAACHWVARLGGHRWAWPGAPLGHPLRANCVADIIEPTRPPLARNRCMVERVGLVVAVPAQEGEVLRSGTWATVRHARRRGRPRILIGPDGSVRREEKS